jgi:hypothetical protein
LNLGASSFSKATYIDFTIRREKRSRSGDFRDVSGIPVPQSDLRRFYGMGSEQRMIASSSAAGQTASLAPRGTAWVDNIIRSFLAINSTPIAAITTNIAGFFHVF